MRKLHVRAGVLDTWPVGHIQPVKLCHLACWAWHDSTMLVVGSNGLTNCGFPAAIFSDPWVAGPDKVVLCARLGTQG